MKRWNHSELRAMWVDVLQGHRLELVENLMEHVPPEENPHPNGWGGGTKPGWISQRPLVVK